MWKSDPSKAFHQEKGRYIGEADEVVSLHKQGKPKKLH